MKLFFSKTIYHGLVPTVRIIRPYNIFNKYRGLMILSEHSQRTAIGEQKCVYIFNAQNTMRAVDIENNKSDGKTNHGTPTVCLRFSKVE